MTSVDYQPMLHRFPQSAPVTMRWPAGDADQKTGAPETVKRRSAQPDLTADLRKAVNPVLDYPICPPGIFQLTGSGLLFSRITRWFLMSIRQRILSPGFQPNQIATSGGKDIRYVPITSLPKTRVLLISFKSASAIIQPFDLSTVGRYTINILLSAKKYPFNLYPPFRLTHYIILTYISQVKNNNSLIFFFGLLFWI